MLLLRKRKIDNRENKIITLVIEFEVQFCLNVKYVNVSQTQPVRK